MSTASAPAVGHPVGVVARYVVLGAALGAPIGVLWAWRAPRVQVRSLSEPSLVLPYPQEFAETDLILGVLLACAGLGLGVTACIRLHRTGFAAGWVQVLGLVAGAAVCAAVARVVGWWLAGRSAHALGDGTYELPITVGADGVLLTALFTGLLVVVLFAAFAREPVRSGSGQSVPS